MIDQRSFQQYMNDLEDLKRTVDRLAARESPMTGRPVLGLPTGSTISTSNTAFVPTDTSCQINKRNASSDIVVLFDARCYHSSPGNDVYIGIALNGVTGVVQGYPVRVPSSSIQANPVAMVFTGQPVGSYNPYMYFRVDTGTGNLYGPYRWILAYEGSWWP